VEACLLGPTCAAFDGAGNLLICDSFSNRVRAVRMAVTGRVQCPPGYACPCAGPIPCLSPASFCPGDLAAPFAVNQGYYSLPEGSAVKTQQAPCPVGSYCTEGVRMPCPPGTVGLPGQDQQVAVSGCSKCAAGSYVAVPASQVRITCCSRARLGAKHMPSAGRGRVSAVS
jgi:hypothetical protein